MAKLQPLAEVLNMEVTPQFVRDAVHFHLSRQKQDSDRPSVPVPIRVAQMRNGNFRVEFAPSAPEKVVTESETREAVS